MYQDSGYGENWRPTENIARRTDPYARSCVILICLFTVGFLIIIIIILSLIPIYISKNSSNKSIYRQVSRVFIKNLHLEFDSLPNFEDVFSNTNNLLTIQASLTALIQQDAVLRGSILDTSVSSKANQTFDFNVIANTSCQVNRCLILFQQQVINRLTGSKSIFRYEQIYSNSTKEYIWTKYTLPQTIPTNASFVTINPNSIASALQMLLEVDKTMNQLS